MNLKRISSSVLATIIIFGTFTNISKADDSITNDSKQFMELTLNPNEPTIKTVTNSSGEEVEIGTQMVWTDSIQPRLWWNKDIPTGNSRWKIWINNSLIGGAHVEYYINVNRASSKSRATIKSYDSEIVRYIPGDLKYSKMVRYNKYKVWHEAQWTKKSFSGKTITTTGRLGSEITTKNKLNCWIE